MTIWRVSLRFSIVTGAPGIVWRLAICAGAASPVRVSSARIAASVGVPAPDARRLARVDRGDRDAVAECCRGKLAALLRRLGDALTGPDSRVQAAVDKELDERARAIDVAGGDRLTLAERDAQMRVCRESRARGRAGSSAPPRRRRCSRGRVRRAVCRSPCGAVRVLPAASRRRGTAAGRSASGRPPPVVARRSDAACSCVRRRGGRESSRQARVSRRAVLEPRAGRASDRTPA